MIVRYDATIDDLVDVGMRSWANSKTVRLWRWQAAAGTGLMAAMPAYILLGVISVSAGARLVIALVTGLIGAALYLWSHEENFRKRTRKICREQIGTDAPFAVTVELLESGISFSQLGTRITYEWPRIERVEETEDALYFVSRNNTRSAVRKRGFESVAMKDEFLTLAETYMQRSRGPLCSK
jgi:hypothetical protein